MKISRVQLSQAIITNAHYIMAAILLLFVVAAVVLGELLNMYDTFWWWDDMLHSSSGVIFGLVGLFAIYAINKRTDMRISPLFVAAFVFCFAVALGVVWEIYEFILDVSFKTTMQQWNMGQNAIVIGKEYQGMGLRDTMSDLIGATIGAVIAAAFSYFAYAQRRKVIVDVMSRAIPAVEKK